MAWIQVHQTLKDHRKVYAVADELDIEPAHALGLIVSFWLWAIDNAPSGSLEGISNRMIARAAEWSGNADEFVDALKTANFLDETGTGLELHDWKEYTGSLIDKRETEKQRSRNRRAEAKKNKLEEQQTTAVQTADATQTDQQKTAGRVEYSRVEYSRDIIGGNNTLHTPQSAQDQRFDLFWTAYPKKVGKAAAKKSWNKVKPNGELFEKIMEAIDAAKRSEQWLRENGRFIPNPATWLNQGRWDDEIPEPAPRFSQPQSSNGGKVSTMSVLAGIIASEEGGEAI